MPTCKFSFYLSMFVESYLHDEIEESENFSMAKLFVHPPNKINDRLIYKLNDYKLTATVKDYGKKHTLWMDKDRLLLLSFLVKKYLREFGNNWRLITQFVQMNTCFSKYLITSENIQEIYQIVQKLEEENGFFHDIELWDKKILPFSVYGGRSYEEFGEKHYGEYV